MISAVPFQLRAGDPKSQTRLAAETSLGSIGMKTHVLFVIDQLEGMGGAERNLLNVIRLLPRGKFRCSLATFKLESRWDVLNQVPCPVYHFPLRRTYDWNAMRAAFQMRRLIRSEQVAIVHTFFETSDIWGGLVAKLSGCPILISSRRDMGIFRSTKHRIAYRMMNSMTDQVLAVSEEVRTFCLREDGLDAKKVLTLYNGIELEKIVTSPDSEGLRKKLGLAGAFPLVATVANVRAVKGIDTFIRAAAIVVREFPSVVFLVVGRIIEHEHFAKLQELTRSLGLAERVRFVEGLGDVFSLLKASSVFCLLSRSEGFSNALIEAMACGLPCVATHVGGNGEAMEDKVTGFLVGPEDVKSAADRISELLRYPDRAKRMGEAGQKIVEERFTLRVMMTRLVAIYDHLLATRLS